MPAIAAPRLLRCTELSASRASPLPQVRGLFLQAGQRPLIQHRARRLTGGRAALRFQAHGEHHRHPDELLLTLAKGYAAIAIAGDQSQGHRFAFNRYRPQFQAAAPIHRRQLQRFYFQIIAVGLDAQAGLRSAAEQGGFVLHAVAVVEQAGSHDDQQ